MPTNRKKPLQPINPQTSFVQQILIHRDEDFIIVNKPAGLLTVPGKSPDLADCLIARLKAELPQALLIHRLDRDTSGVMVFALNPAAQRHISKQFELRQTSKQYTALVMGELHGSGTIDIPVRYEPTTPPLHVTDPAHPKNALTHWQALETCTLNQQTVTRMQLTPITGRSHQLRVHLLHIGHAIVGDELYADQLGISLSPRLCLHAAQLGFLHPVTSEPLSFQKQADF
jgi:tRNA pseudouridine32 synthase/23S rRNA pseudouridine746 synthase